MAQSDAYDLVVVGSSFASAFFLKKYLEFASSSSRVLVLERGDRHDHQWYLDNVSQTYAEPERHVYNETLKRWTFNLGFGGTSNRWWANTPRMMPADFELRTRYGQGVDWPVSYDDLEPYYCDVEETMSVSGPSNEVLFPRSRPYPQRPHVFTAPDRILKSAYPDLFFQMPTGRARTSPPSGRAQCCAIGRCHACPVDSKFTVMNEMAGLFEDPRLTVAFGAQVETLEYAGNAVTGVRYRQAGEDRVARADAVALGANAIFNPFIMLKSGLEHPELGRGLGEQVGIYLFVDLDGVDNFQGSTSLTGHGYMLYDGPHRTRKAAAMIETSNVPQLRDERGKWRQRLRMRFIFEDLRQSENRVRFDPARPDKPVVEYHGFSPYTQRGLDELETELPGLLAPLPITGYRLNDKPEESESHIQGTTVMGNDAATSVIDAGLLHHTLRNLFVLGSGAYPTSAPANPTLTLSALSLRAADRAFR